MADPTIVTFRRSQAADGAPSVAGRLRRRIGLALTDLHGAEQSPAGTIEFELMGPKDVSGLKPGAVRRTYPVNGAFNVETDKCPYAEFAADDLPWRYSPDANGNRMRPWLLLVVGTPQEITLLPGGRVVLGRSLVDSYERAVDPDDPDLPRKSHLWAHAQEHDGKRVSRLLSPRSLASDESYVAVLVPAFDDRGAFKLPAGKAIPAYYWWRFTTSTEGGSFVELAKRLEPFSPPANMGLAAVAYEAASGEAEVFSGMLVGGALVGPNSGVPPKLPEDVSEDFVRIRPQADRFWTHDEDGRPVVQLPLYGEPWLAQDADEPKWMRELNDDPRHRGVAGLGMWAGIEWQDRIVSAAAQQLGALYTAARRIRQLTSGLAATRSLWDRRLPTDEIHRLQVLGPAMVRLATPQGNSVLDHVTASAHAMLSALFSSAARRLLRPGTARARQVQEGALAPGPLFERLNTCPPDDTKHQGNLVHVDHIVGDDLDQIIAERLDHGAEFGPEETALVEAEGLHQQESQTRLELGLEADESWLSAADTLWEWETRVALLDAVHAPRPVRPCEDPSRQPNLLKLSDAVGAAFDPHGERPFIVRRVLATIQGLDDQPLTPPELCLDLDIPAWKFLKEFAQDWFLPGLGQMQFEVLDATGQLVSDPSRDPVIAAETNGHFSDAFMVGLNQQALAELRWRNVPVAAGCTPLRRFWEPIADGKACDDIVDIHLWQDDTPLGDAQHEAPAAQGGNLVLIFKSPLWRRYPETLIYLLPRQTVSGRPEPNWAGEHIQPNLHVEIERDVVAFGFANQASVLHDHWIVIEQVPRGICFYNLSQEKGQRANDKTNSVQFAEEAFANPVRVLILGSELLP